MKHELLPFLLGLAVMAGVTYLVRMLPLALCKKKIENRFLCSFLQYIPYAVLGAMTVPAVFYATADIRSAAAGVAVALLLSFCKRSLLTVSIAASVAVYGCEWLLRCL